MPSINESVFQDFCKISQNVQRIQEKITNHPINPQIRKSLHKELETLQDSIETLRDQTQHVQQQATIQFSHLEEMENQIVSLYREIEERFENYEISLISEEALDLSSSLESGKMLNVAKQVHALQHNIHFLFKHRLPSLQHRKIVHLALKILDYAHAALSTKGKTSKEQIKLIHLLKMLLQEAVLRIGMQADLAEEEFAMELYEIVDLFYRKEKNEGRLKLTSLRSQLSRAQRTRIDSAGDDDEALIPILLEIADGDPCIEWDSYTKESVIYALHA